MFKYIQGEMYGPVLTNEQKKEIKRFFEESTEVYLEVEYSSRIGRDWYKVRYTLYNSKDGIDYSKEFYKNFYCNSFYNGQVAMETNTLVIVYDQGMTGEPEKWVDAFSYKRIK